MDAGLAPGLAEICSRQVITHEDIENLKGMRASSTPAFDQAMRDVLIAPTISDTARVHALILFDRLECRFALDGDADFLTMLGTIMCEEAWQAQAARILLRNASDCESIARVLAHFGPESYPHQVLCLQMAKTATSFQPDLFEKLLCVLGNEGLDGRIRFTACKALVAMSHVIPHPIRNECNGVVSRIVERFGDSVDNCLIVGSLLGSFVERSSFDSDEALAKHVHMAVILSRYLRERKCDPGERRIVCDVLSNYLHAISLPLVIRVKSGRHCVDMRLVQEFMHEMFWQCEPDEGVQQSWQSPEGWYCQIEDGSGDDDDEDDAPSVRDRACYLLVQMGNLILDEVVKQERYDYKACLLIGIMISAVDKNDAFKRKVEAVSDPLAFCEIWRAIRADPSCKDWKVPPESLQAILQGSQRIPRHVTDIVAWKVLAGLTTLEYDPLMFVAAFEKGLRYLGPDGEFTTCVIADYAQEFHFFTKQCLDVPMIRNAFLGWPELKEAWVALFKSMFCHKYCLDACEQITLTLRAFLVHDEFVLVMLPCIMEIFGYTVSRISSVDDGACCSEIVSQLFFIPCVFEQVPANIINILGSMLEAIMKEDISAISGSMIDVLTLLLLKGKRGEVIQMFKHIIASGQVARAASIKSIGTLLFTIIRSFDGESVEFMRFLATLEADRNRWQIMMRNLIEFLYLSDPEKTVSLVQTVFGPARPFEAIIQQIIASTGSCIEATEMKLHLAFLRKALESYQQLLPHFFNGLNTFLPKLVAGDDYSSNESSIYFSELSVVTQDCKYLIAPPAEFLEVILAGIELPPELQERVKFSKEFFALPRDDPRRHEMLNLART